MSSKKKLFAIIAAVAMLAGMLAFGAVPSFAATTNLSLSTPNVTVPSVTGNVYQVVDLGTLQIGGINAAAIPSGGDVITLSLPSGVSFPGGTDYSTTGTAGTSPYGVVATSSGSDPQSVAIGTVQILSSKVMQFTITPVSGKTTYAGYVNVSFSGSWALGIGGAAAGPINVTVGDNAAVVSPGNVTIGTVVSGGTVTTVNDTATVTPGSSAASGIQVAMAENSVGALTASTASSNTIYLTLPQHFSWSSVTVTGAGGFTGDSITSSIVNSGSGTNNKLYIILPSKDSSSPGTMYINASIEADSSAPLGSVTATVGGTNSVTAATVTVATSANYGVTVTAASAPDVFLGQTGQGVANVTIAEGVAGSLIGGRSLSLALPAGYRWYFGDSLPSITLNSGNMSLTFDHASSDLSTLYFNVAQTDTSASNLTVGQLEIDVDGNAPTGNVVATIGGTAGATGTITLASAVTPVTATAASTPSVALGQSNQAAGSFTLTENAAGAIQAASSGTDYLYIDAPAGVSFGSVPSVSVTSGDLTLNTAGIVLGNANAGVNNEVQIPIKYKSTKASTVSVSGVNLTVQGNVPTGPVTLTFGGSALINTVTANTTWKDNNNNSYTESSLNGTSVGSVTVATAGGSAAAGGNASFTVGANVYTVGGVSYVMDVAPYISNGRTFVPVRYLGDSLGATVAWDGTTQTVTLTAGSDTVVLTIGSTTETVNGTAQTMDVAPVIVNGRTMLPARWVAEALGYQVGWNPATQVVLLTK